MNYSSETINKLYYGNRLINISVTNGGGGGSSSAETALKKVIEGSVTNIDIPSGTTNINTYKFYGCTILSSVTIPSSVINIGDGAFSGCTSLTSITVNAITPPRLGSIAFSNTNDCPIYVPSASVEAYKSASGWSEYASRIQAIPT